MMACLTMLRKEKVGFRKSVYDSLTLIAPSILIVFELSIFRYYPNWINSEVTVFAGELGLGGIITNLFVMEVSLALVVLRLILGVHSRWVGPAAKVRVRSQEGPKKLAKARLDNEV
jgi:hypothetical protein